MKTFKELGLSSTILKAIEKKGYTTTTGIQEKTIPLLLEGKDVIGESQTGSGKTAAFALPIIEQVNPESRNVQAIILAPTRELAMQVAKEFETLRGDKNVYSLAVYGGSSMSEQLSQLKRGVQVIVGTPGRTLDLIKRRALDLTHVKFAVLDEADEMLNMGFIEDIETIIGSTPKDKKMLLFSATMPRAIIGIAKKFMRDPVHVKLERHEATLQIEEFYYNVMAKDKCQVIRRVVDMNDDFYGIIFCNTKADVDSVTHQLLNSDYRAAALHGDISQPQREKILLQLRNKQITILVATDVAARGIDVNDLTHVVNFSLPQSPENYTHRIGRTARAGKKGIAITLLTPSDKRKLKFIERLIHREIAGREIPSTAEIVATRKSKMITKVHTLIESGTSTQYEGFAEDLLANHEPKLIISTLLKEAFSGVLDEKRYQNLKTVTANSERSDRGDRKSFGRSRPSSRDRGLSDRDTRTKSRGSGRSYDRGESSGDSGRSLDRKGPARSFDRKEFSSSSGRSFERKESSGSSGRSFDRKGPARTYERKESSGSSGRSFERKDSGRSYERKESSGSSGPPRTYERKEGSGRDESKRSPKKEGSFKKKKTFDKPRDSKPFAKRTAVRPKR
ncbi:RNA helicase [Candidatus Woesearchaeota archaeon CG10_big_fil_rev_8_21_14_0_10_32_24]|nr:MAG: RNA helicase [Candidatus Woesearchaeota archaeon CG10_big_fil_rev_8_21_14_0_10_32_24]